jgi:hypothetical protein
VKRAGRLAIVAVLALLVAAGLAWRFLVAGGTGPGEPGAAREPTVVFVVVDMWRADRLAACGCGRPTPPNLDRLAAEPGAAFTCAARSPGTWTLPSHASFLTGEEVPVHGADGVLDPAGVTTVSLWGDHVRPLPGDLPTLAERMRERGYRTALVSGNPVVSAWSGTGLARGFDVIRESRQFGDTYGARLVAALGEALDESERRAAARPLFLFVNVCDAHHPWEAVPAGLGWVPPRIALDNRPRDPQNPYPRFFRDQLDQVERRLFLELIGDAYDHAVWRADRTLGRVLALLEVRGVLGPDHRLVVVSDHGEYLGEHDLLSHGIFVYEEDTRVPLLFRERRAGRSVAPPAFPEPISALTAYDLALDGALPARPRPVRAAGYPDGLLSRLFGERLRATTAAEWDGDRKLFWKNGEFSLFDLRNDPRELSPLPLPADDPLRPRFEAFVEQVQATGRRKVAPTPEMIEALRKLGYVE